MSISIEAIHDITNFHIGRKFDSSPINLGIVVNSEGKRISVAYGIFHYQLRNTNHPEEPLLFGKWTRQPTLALVVLEDAYPLPYATNVRRLPDHLVDQVVEVLRGYKLKQALGRGLSVNYLNGTTPVVEPEKGIQTEY